jgi:PAS domain S-box-containing protein
MKPAPIEENELERLAALHQYRILDSAAEVEFDEVTQLAAQICGTPIALVSLVDAGRQWFKSRVGLDAAQTPRDISFCGHAIHGSAVFEVSNTLEDERFFDNPLVTQDPNIRFYAGAPLVTAQGHALGTLCVIDRVPHTLTPAQKSSLATLGRQVVRQMELRLFISREQQLNLELSRQATFQKVLLDSAVAAVISSNEEGLITSFNPAAERLLGYSAEEMVGKQSVSVFHLKEDLQARAQELSLELGREVGPREAVVAKALMGISETREWRYRRKNGSLVPVMLSVAALHDDAGGLTGFVGLGWDITERKNADLALRHSEARLQLAMSAGRISLWDANPVTGRIAMDARWGELVGDEPKDISISFQQLVSRVPPEEVPEVVVKMRAVLKGERPEYVAEHRVLHRKGHWVWVESRGRVVARDANGKVTRMIGTNTDITERKQGDQMKAEFVSTVSHELRTPLTSISGALGLVCGGALGPVTDQAKSMLDIAYKNSQRLTHLINDLLDMEKIAAGKMRFELEVLEIMPLVEQAIESTREYAQPYQVSLMLQERADGVRVRVDASRLQQVLSNFLSNAVKFSPQGAQVEVQVRQGQGGVRVEVVDHGAGIPAEFRSRIFQKFSQADSSDTRQKGGSGLGLAISKELMERMHGKVGFESQQGQGASFFFELPVWTEQTLSPEVAGLEISGATRMLVVEDDPDIASLLVLMLNRAGYSADVAGTCEMALQLLEQRSYTALTLDLMLPDDSGVTLIRKLRSQVEFEKLPVIVVSAFLDDGKLAINGDFTAVDWLAKPIDEKRLIDAVRRCLPAQTHGRVKVLHVEDDADLHHIVATLGREVAEFELAHTLEQARERLAQGHYDLVILDIVLPDGTGWSLLPAINALQPAPPVIVLSGLETSAQEQRAVNHVLLKSRTSTENLLATIKQVIENSQLTPGTPDHETRTNSVCRR